jgi:heparosan-N-sulfate-glucuronate 5-epimerase
MSDRGDPHHYHFDLRHKALEHGPSAADGLKVLDALVSERATANPVWVVQFGLGTLQLRDPDRLEAVDRTAGWIEQELTDDGYLPYLFPMHHTFPLDPPWHSSLAQGEAVSFLVRAAMVLDRPHLIDVAGRAARPLLDPGSELRVETPEGVVLEEYPTATPSFVLNGWITSLWGLHDLADARASDELRQAARAEFEAGVDVVAARLHRYRSALGWSRYDLYPHPLVNVASPAYHTLHISHLETLNTMASRPQFTSTLAEWRRAASNPLARSLALGRKVAFRAVRPRSRRIRPQQRPLS